MEASIPEIFAHRVELLMKNQFLTKAGVAKRLNIGYTTFWRKLNGTRKVDFDLLERLAEILGTSISYLIGETDNPNRFYTALSNTSESSHLGTKKSPHKIDYSYWIEVINKTRDVIERADANEILSVEQFLKVSYNMISNHMQSVKT